MSPQYIHETFQREKSMTFVLVSTFSINYCAKILYFVAKCFKSNGQSLCACLKEAYPKQLAKQTKAEK